MRNLTKILVLSLTMIGFVACEKASETLVTIPSVTMDCNSTDNPVCITSSGSPTGRVIMTRSGCSNVNFEPIASGTTVMTCGPSGCLGTVGSWVDTNGNGVSEIISGRMDICGLIDFQGDNLQEDTGDVVNETSESIQSSQTIVLEVWEEVQ